MDHSSSNGHLPGLPIKSSGDKKSLVLLVLTTLILVIGSLNYLQLQQLRIVYETVLSEPDEEMISEAQSLKPRVWIQGKRVGSIFLFADFFPYAIFTCIIQGHFSLSSSAYSSKPDTLSMCLKCSKN